MNIFDRLALFNEFRLKNNVIKITEAECLCHEGPFCLTNCYDQKNRLRVQWKKKDNSYKSSLFTLEDSHSYCKSLVINLNVSENEASNMKSTTADIMHTAIIKGPPHTVRNHGIVCQSLQRNVMVDLAIN